jgi:hypothetical protein
MLVNAQKKFKIKLKLYKIMNFGKGNFTKWENSKGVKK